VFSSAYYTAKQGDTHKRLRSRPRGWSDYGNVATTGLKHTSKNKTVLTLIVF